MAVVDRENLVRQVEIYKRQLDRENGGESSRTLFNKRENYKHNVARKAVEALNVASWQEAEIGTGAIGKRVEQAVKKHVNLIGRFQVSAFSDRIRKASEEADRIFYDLYHEHKEEECFERLCELFGRRYDLIAYLYFIMDPDRYLPMKPSFLDNAFRLLNIDFQATGRCSWENYLEFVQTVSTIKNMMKEYFQKEDIDLLDAHSFLWSLHLSSSEADRENSDNDPDEELVPRIGARISHRVYGEGLIVFMNEEDCYTDFSGKRRIFPADSFERGYLKLV